MPARKTPAARARRPAARKDRTAPSDAAPPHDVLEAIEAAKVEILKAVNDRINRVEMRLMILDWTVRRVPHVVAEKVPQVVAETYETIRKNYEDGPSA